MVYIYPAVFHECEEGGYAVFFPDLPGTNTQGETLKDAIEWAGYSLVEWLEYLMDKNMEIPPPSHVKDVKLDGDNEFATLIYVKMGYNLMQEDGRCEGCLVEA